MVIIEKAYHWLTDHYQDGDRIFLFGFSRGAYQVRALAGMIQKLGFVFPGNIGLIPFAYELYANRHRGKVIKDEVIARTLSKNFKHTFSRQVKVHFVGVWDTVTSVGLIQKSPLPLTTTAHHICTFRHGLALDEQRVKFLPTYLAGGWTPNLRLDLYNPDDQEMDVKEVWFVGSHSDVGGSNDPHALSLGLVPLLWMENQAIDTGLRCRPRSFFGDWTWDNIHKNRPTISLRSFWRLLEVLPITRYQYTDPNATTRIPHFGKGRSIVPRQNIHVSVAFSRENYKPKARLFGDKTMDLESIINIGIKSDPDEAGDLSWADEWRHVLEMDLFDDGFAQAMINRLHSFEPTESNKREEDSGLDAIAIKEQVRLLRRLPIMALSNRSAKAISNEIGNLVKMLEASHDIRIRTASASCLFQLANHGYSQQIISEKDALTKLRKILEFRQDQKDNSELKIASLQCLLQLVLDSKVSESTDCYSGPTVTILLEDEQWTHFLYDYLRVGDGLGPNNSLRPPDLAGLSCLMRMAKIDFLIRPEKKFMKWIDDSPEDDISTITVGVQKGWSKLVSKLLWYLSLPQTGFHAALTPRNMSREVTKRWSTDSKSTQGNSSQKSDLLKSLMLGIHRGNSTAKGTYMRCLSEYCTNDKIFRQEALQTTKFMATLVTDLFGTETHCSRVNWEKKQVISAFLTIMLYKLQDIKGPGMYFEIELLKLQAMDVRNLDGTENIKDVIRKILEAICVESWLDEKDGSTLLHGIFNLYNKVLCTNLPDASLERDASPQPDRTEMLKMIITEMLQLTRSTQLRNNGVQSDLGYTLNRVQLYLKVLLELHKGDNSTRPLFDDSDVIGTIIRAMKHRKSRVKAVEFLELLAKQGAKDSNLRDEKGSRFMGLLTDIIELGRKLMANNKRPIFAIFQSGGTRNNGEGARPLANVRDALRALVPYECLRARILKSENFEIISKSIDFHDIMQKYRGDRVEADIARIKCLRALIAYGDARGKMNADVISPLLDLHQAFNEESGSSQWLHTWTGYGELLEATLLDLREKADVTQLGEEVRERLGRIQSARSQSVQTSKMGPANGSGASEP
ncbi:uncharacterized protein ARMOST_04449 [Armillaria ostoyae]|uniref:T6SS Phospholipase effector Tle1-like catalytic domain-containing protein n=1 Tax=Armillaria ostoyae TaxID=47428 RepID=A0A284QXD5_ARMOS|nr:uncharacterized protein ARMOST_04449 [Armillaria ostoyae]